MIGRAASSLFRLCMLLKAETSPAMSSHHIAGRLGGMSYGGMTVTTWLATCGVDWQ